MIKPSLKNKSDIFKVIISLTLRPQLYKVSSIALSLSPSGLLKSTADISWLISDSDKVSYFAPAIGGLTLGVSYMDGGVAGDTDSTSFGGKFITGEQQV